MRTGFIPCRMGPQEDSEQREIMIRLRCSQDPSGCVRAIASEGQEQEGSEGWLLPAKWEARVRGWSRGSGRKGHSGF